MKQHNLPQYFTKHSSEKLRVIALKLVGQFMSVKSALRARQGSHYWKGEMGAPWSHEAIVPDPTTSTASSAARARGYCSWVV